MCGTSAHAHCGRYCFEAVGVHDSAEIKWMYTMNLGAPHPFLAKGLAPTLALDTDW